MYGSTLEHPLHIWCVEEEKRDKQEKKVKEDRNRDAATMLVTNAIHTFKDSTATSLDFIRLNNKDQLCDLIGEKFAL